ncbi:hypothetical protein MTsPCn5_08890 [Croceitalea sp. MTPC5]|nr:hypothetical protein MTsPCn5_08890 [Croceitalea sp. MTPC5]
MAVSRPFWIQIQYDRRIKSKESVAHVPAEAKKCLSASLASSEPLKSPWDKKVPCTFFCPSAVFKFAVSFIII